MCFWIPSIQQSQAFQHWHHKQIDRTANQCAYSPAAWGRGWTMALFRGVRAGWMGRIPGFGWVCPALGRWRGAIEVSVVGMGSVSLKKKSLFQLKCVGEKKKKKREVGRVHDGALNFPSNLSDLLNQFFPKDGPQNGMLLLNALRNYSMDK